MGRKQQSACPSSCRGSRTYGGVCSLSKVLTLKPTWLFPQLSLLFVDLQQTQLKNAPDTFLPHLVGLLHNLSSSITTFSIHPLPVALQRHSLYDSRTRASSGVQLPQTDASEATGECTHHESTPLPEMPSITTMIDNNDDDINDAALRDGGPTASTRSGSSSKATPPSELLVLGAAATTSGTVEIIAVRRGLINAFAPEVVLSLCVHKDTVRGVRWLGQSTRLVSFSSEKTQHAYRNSLFVSDIRTRRR